jgi:D-lactate dehydrogenase (cytochrome)
MPVPVLYKLVEDMTKRLKDHGLYTGPVGDWNPSSQDLIQGIIGYGHIGDGNLHLNISARHYAKEIEDVIEPFVYEWTKQHGGSISAEHGLGQMKAAYVGYSKSDVMVHWMRNVKKMFDPNGIMNPYKFLPPEKQ